MAATTVTDVDAARYTRADTTSMTGMQKMSRVMWAPWLVMGLMIMVTSFILGAINSGANVVPWFENGKAVREAAEAGSAIVADKVGIETLKAFIPGFKFLGMGFLFGGITFIVATVLGTLRDAGYRVQSATGAEARFLKKPLEGKLFPMLMMMGFMILIATFIIGIWLAGQNADYWNHSIANELNPAGAGDALLAQLGRIQAVQAWQVPLKFFGVATMLAAIGLALATIIKVLRFQSHTVADLVSRHGGHDH